jgi:hypothetical protein
VSPRRFAPLLAAALLAAAPAAAQEGTEPIRPGDALAGRVEAGAPDAFGRGGFRAYHADLRAGQRLVATAESGDFDTYLAVGRMAGPVFDLLKADDDGGGGTDSRLRFTAPRDGRYLLLVQSYRADGTGEFRVSLTAAPEPTTGAASPLAIGARVEGELSESDRVDDDRGRFYDVYTFRGTAGQRISASLESARFDPFLVLGRMHGGEMMRIATDDDGGPGTDALLRHTLPEEGEYVLHATSFGADETGAYVLSLEERATAAASRRPLASEAEAEGELDEEDPTMDADGSFYEEWTFEGRSGQRVRIRMASRDFDTYLSVGREQEGEFREIGNNDDGDEGTDSMLEVTLPADGQYVVRANSYSAGETGSYTLFMETVGS